MGAWRGRSCREKRRDERGRCARKGAKLTRGPGSAAGVSSASRGGARARAERGLQAFLARAERAEGRGARAAGRWAAACGGAGPRAGAGPCGLGQAGGREVADRAGKLGRGVRKGGGGGLC